MAKISESFEFGSDNELTQEELLDKIKKMYRELAEAVNRKVEFVERSTDGQTADTFLSNGTINLNTSTLKVEMLTEHTDPSTVVWTQLS